MERAEALEKLLEKYDEESLMSDVIQYYNNGNSKEFAKNPKYGYDIFTKSKEEILEFLRSEKKNKETTEDQRNLASSYLKSIFSEGLVAPRTFSLRPRTFSLRPRTFSLRADNGRAMYSNVCTRKCSERRTFMRGGTALNLYVEPGASFRGHHWRTMLKTMYADKLPSKFDLYHARGKVDMAALVHGNVHSNMTIRTI